MSMVESPAVRDELQRLRLVEEAREGERRLAEQRADPNYERPKWPWEIEAERRLSPPLRSRQAVPAAPQPPAALTEAEARAQLGEALQDLEAAEIEAAEAADNAERAATICQELDAKLRDYADLDERIDSHNVAAIKAGREAPLPISLQNAQTERGKLVDRIASAHRALTQLQTESRHAAARVQAAQTIAGERASAVMSCLADAKAGQLLALEEQAYDLRCELLSMARCSFMTNNRGVQPLALTERTKSLLRGTPRNTSTNEVPELMQLWMGRWRKLLQDPAATWPDECPPD